MAIGIFLVLVAASLMITMQVQPASEVETYKKYLRDRGEKLELSELVPPPVAAEDNSAAAVEEAFGRFNPSTTKMPNVMRMVAPGQALVGWRQPDSRGYDFTNSWDEFAAEVEADHPAIELLHQVLARPKLDFQLDYNNDASLLSHLTPMQRAAQILDAAGVLDLHQGQIGAAATNILTLLALVHKDVRDEFFVSHLARITMTSIALPLTWELLQATNRPEWQLAAVQNGWQQLDFLGDAERAFEMYRASSAVTIQKSNRTHEGFKETFGDPLLGSGGSSSSGSYWSDILEGLTAGPRMAFAESMWRSSWSYSAELNMLKNNQVILEALRTMQTNQSQFYKADYDAMAARLSALSLPNSGAEFFCALRIPDFRDYFEDEGLARVVRKTLQVETARRVVVTAIALKRFQLEHGQWPEALSDLVPGFLPSVPIDPYDGKPLKFHPNADGTFLLYSVGEDGVDDGGDPTSTTAAGGSSSLSWQNPKARDWVWPQPASPAEVQSFYEHPPK